MNLEKCRLDCNNQLLPTMSCPTCGIKLDSASRPGPESIRPRPGDFSICIGCGEIFVFAEDMTIRMPTLTELIAVKEEEQEKLTIAQNKIRQERPMQKYEQHRSQRKTK